MKLLKTPAGLFLLVQTLHLAALQDSTDSPGRTIDKSWLRKPFKAEVESNLSADTGEFNTDDINGTPSGFMLGNTDEENLLNGDLSGNQTSDDLSAFPSAMSPISENTTTEQLDSIEHTTNTTTGSTDVSQTDVTEAEEEFNSTATTENSTGGGDFFNKTETQPTTRAPESKTTGETTTPEAGGELANSSVAANTTTNMTTVGPGIEETSSTLSSTLSSTSSSTSQPSEEWETSTMTTTTESPNTPERANKPGKGASSSERGVQSDIGGGGRRVTWLAVLGTAAGVALVGLVAFVIHRKKQQKAFTHRKLVEEFPSDPVLRFDNSEPLDLNFGGSAYYNPGLQGDSIQMSSLRGQP